MNEPHDTEEGKTPDSSGQSRARLATPETLEKLYGSGGLLIGLLYRPRASDYERDDDTDDGDRQKVD
jgi:hypothetical protein